MWGCHREHQQKGTVNAQDGRTHLAWGSAPGATSMPSLGTGLLLLADCFARRRAASDMMTRPVSLCVSLCLSVSLSVSLCQSL